MTHDRHTRHAAATMAVFAMVVVGLQAVHDREAGTGPTNASNVLYVRSPEALKRIALSYDSLVADIYWMRALQLYGGTKLSTDPAKSYDLLYPLLDLTTSLDTRFNVAYHFGAIFLAERPPDGPGRPDLAVALLKKGLQAQPRRWEFAQYIGFVYYWWYRDYEEAASWFKKASEFPGAPVWLASLAATTLAEGGSRESSRLLWKQLASTADDGWLRRESIRRLQQLNAMDELDALRGAVEAYRHSRGTDPASWDDLRRIGYLRGNPLDPTGLSYQLHDGTVTLDPKSRLNPLPLAPQRLQ